MAEIDRDKVAAAINAEFASDARPEAAMAVSAEALGNAKKLFCENWDTVKQVLDFLATVAPGPIGPIIRVVIRAGDAAKKVIC